MKENMPAARAGWSWGRVCQSLSAAEQALWYTSEAAALTASGTGSRFLEGKVQLFSEVRKEEAHLSATFSWHGGELSLLDRDGTRGQQPRSRHCEGTLLSPRTVYLSPHHLSVPQTPHRQNKVPPSEAG